MSRLFSRLCGALAAVVLAVPFTASAEDWANSLYTAGGTELRADERVFTLFALLNEMGHDEAPIGRTNPIPRREFDPIRQQVRDEVALPADLRAKFEAFFDKNPQPLRSYTAYVLALGSAPTFTAPARLPKAVAGLKGFETLLAEFYTKAQIKPLFEKLQVAQREALKAYTDTVDKPLAQAREILKAPETDDSPRVVVVVNLLDGRGSSYGVADDDTVYLVVGPAGDKPDPTAMIKAFARVELQPAAEARGITLKGGKDLLTEVQQSGYPVGSETVADYIAETMARAVAIRAAVPNGQAGAFEAERRKGFVLINEMNRGLVLYAKSPKPMPVFLADFLREVDASKAAAALKGN